MQVTNRQQSNKRDRDREGKTSRMSLGQRVGTYSREVWLRSGSRMGWQESVRKVFSLFSPSSCVNDPAPVSLPGLVEEDVSWLRVLGDVWGKAVKLLDGLGINFLHNTRKTSILPIQTTTVIQTDESTYIKQNTTGWEWVWHTSTMSSSNSSQKPWLFTMVI